MKRWKEGIQQAGSYTKRRGSVFANPANIAHFQPRFPSRLPAAATQVIVDHEEDSQVNGLEGLTEEHLVTKANLAIDQMKKKEGLIVKLCIWADRRARIAFV